LVTYSSDATTVSSLTYDFVALKNNIGGMSASGSTNCAQALYKARQVLQGNSRLTAVKAIVFMSDGVCNTSSGSTCSGGTDPQKAICEADKSKALGYSVYTIGLGTGADKDTLKAIASSVDDFAYAPTPAELNAAYEQIFERIKRFRLVQ
jgi:Mg-chelatase subunit ChlD